jgi:hypothetical protein
MTADAAKQWCEEKLKDILRENLHENIYNADDYYAVFFILFMAQIVVSSVLLLLLLVPMG